MAAEHWVLSKEINRKIGDIHYFRYRISVPKKDYAPLMQKAGSPNKIYFKAKIQPGKVILEMDLPPIPISAQVESVQDRAKKIKTFLIRSGGKTTWPQVRDYLGLKKVSTPSPFLVQALEQLGVESVKNPKTSTKVWKLKTNDLENYVDLDSTRGQ